MGGFAAAATDASSELAGGCVVASMGEPGARGTSTRAPPLAGTGSALAPASAELLAALILQRTPPIAPGPWLPA